MRSYPSAHHGAITKMEFSADGNRVLTSGFDGMVRLHGLKSGKTLKEYVNSTVSSGGITNSVSAPYFAHEKEFILMAYSNGLVLLFDAKTAEIVKELLKHPLLTKKSRARGGLMITGKELHVS